ncbi:S26 family signal peptidase [Candidatus Phytoplasma oryzae]|nr:S26 family signal peptidase [Candidatus Phytoplasma oryzae]
MLRFLTKILNFIFYIFLFLYHLLLFYLFSFICFSLFSSQENVIKFFYFNYFVVASGSMKKELNVNDFVIVRKISEKECSKLKKSTTLNSQDGDIVIFKVDKDKFPMFPPDNYNIIHRVVDNNIKEKYITTKGDNNKTTYSYESKIPYKNIIAKYVFKIDSKYIFFMKCIIVVVLCSLIIYFLVSKLQTLIEN